MFKGAGVILERGYLAYFPDIVPLIETDFFHSVFNFQISGSFFNIHLRRRSNRCLRELLIRRKCL